MTLARTRTTALVAGVATLAALAWGTGPLAPEASAAGLGCPEGMVPIQGFCIDAYEASADVVSVSAKGKATTLRRHSSFHPLGEAPVRAVSKKGRVPQGHISQEQAAAACSLAGKRLCTDTEWLTACKGKKPTTWPYGEERVPGRCNDEGTSGMNLLFGGGAEAPREAYTQTNMNDPRLNQVGGSLAAAGSRGKCKNSYGVYDMVGNLHEWTAASGGTFRGGYYLDVTINGEGCDYKTTAHSTKYHDYSTGFRCCWSPGDAKKRRTEASLAQKKDGGKEGGKADAKGDAKAKGGKDKDKSKGSGDASKKEATKKKKGAGEPPKKKKGAESG